MTNSGFIKIEHIRVRQIGAWWQVVLRRLDAQVINHGIATIPPAEEIHFSAAITAKRKVP
jgi:hypothetical protein